MSRWSTPIRSIDRSICLRVCSAVRMPKPVFGSYQPRTGIPWVHDGGFASTYIAHDYGAGIAADRVLQRAYGLLGGVPRAIHVDVDGDAPSGLVAHLQQKARAALVA